MRLFTLAFWHRTHVPAEWRMSFCKPGQANFWATNPVWERMLAWTRSWGTLENVWLRHQWTIGRKCAKVGQQVIEPEDVCSGMLICKLCIPVHVFRILFRALCCNQGLEIYYWGRLTVVSTRFEQNCTVAWMLDDYQVQLGDFPTSTVAAHMVIVVRPFMKIKWMVYGP